MPKKHTVVQGDCLENIAFQYGFFPETIWNHPDNAALSKLRDSASLLPGDVVVIPDLSQKTVSVASDQRHRFRRRGVPSRFQVVLDFGETSVAGLKYTLDIDDGTVVHEGTLDKSGKVDHVMPPDSRHAKLTVGEEVFEFDLGHLDPVETEDGVVARLYALGYLEDGEGVSEERLAAAVLQFQQDDSSLEPTGKLDPATRKAIKDKYDG